MYPVNPPMYQRSLDNEDVYATQLVRVATTSAPMPIGTDIDTPTFTPKHKHKQKPRSLMNYQDNTKPASPPLKEFGLKSQGSARKLGKAISAVSLAMPAKVSTSPVVPKTIVIEPTTYISVSSNGTSKRKFRSDEKPLPLADQFYLPDESLPMVKYTGKSFDEVRSIIGKKGEKRLKYNKHRFKI